MTVLKRYELARVYTSSIGTGSPLGLGAAVPGYLTFPQAGVQNNDLVPYAIRDGVDSEVGTGVYSSAGPTLTRNVSKSTNADAPINLSGSAEIFIGPRAADFGAGPNQALLLDDNGRIPSTVRPTRQITAAGNVTVADNGCVISCGGSTAYTLTHAVTAAQAGNGFRYTIRNITSSFTITIDPAGSETIDGAATLKCYNKQIFDIVCDGTNWFTVNRPALTPLQIITVPSQVSLVDLTLPEDYPVFDIDIDWGQTSNGALYFHGWYGAGTPQYNWYYQTFNANSTASGGSPTANASQVALTPAGSIAQAIGSLQFKYWPSPGQIAGAGPSFLSYARFLFTSDPFTNLSIVGGHSNLASRTNQIRFFVISQNFLVGSRFQLWGRTIA
jgi:hypothetical protein